MLEIRAFSISGCAWFPAYGRTMKAQTTIFDPHACLEALSTAFHNLETAYRLLPTDDRQTVLVAKVYIGSVMEGILDFILDDDRDEAGEGHAQSERAAS